MDETSTNFSIGSIFSNGYYDLFLKVDEVQLKIGKRVYSLIDTDTGIICKVIFYTDVSTNNLAY